MGRWTMQWTGSWYGLDVIVCWEYYSLFWRWSPKGRHPQRETKKRKSEIWPDGGKANINLVESVGRWRRVLPLVCGV